MQTAETLRVLLFLGFVFAVYVLAARTIARAWARRQGEVTSPLSVWSRWTGRVALVLAAASLPCFAYGWLVEPYWPEVTHVRIPIADLAVGRAPIRVVQISDLHSDPKERLEGRLPELVAREHPDLIVFTGDSINSTGGLPVFRKCLTRLAAIAPTFAVRGNWDAWAFPEVDLFGGTGARELDGAAVSLRIRETSVYVAGVGVTNERRLHETLSPLPEDAVTLFLYHYPDLISSVRGLGVDLYCSGHTHGGQVALPFYGALVTLSTFGKRYESGLYRESGTWLYVNRGIGMEGGPVPRVRFCARPEITVFEIVPATPGENHS